MRSPLKYTPLTTALYCLALLALSAPLASAQSQTLDIRPYGERIFGPGLAAHFSGQVHDGAYNFSRDGKARAFYNERHNEDGTVLYIEGDMKSEGRWGVFNDILCYYYNDQALNGGCFRVYRVKNCYFFYSNNLPDDPNEIDGDFWTARSTLKGETQQCEAAIS